MKEGTPYCPTCKTKDFVVLDKRSTPISTAIGGAAGAGAGYAKAIARSPPETKKFIASNPGVTALAIASFILAILMGFATGAATGSAVGEHIDSKMRIQFRCNQCGLKFKG